MPIQAVQVLLFLRLLRCSGMCVGKFLLYMSFCEWILAIENSTRHHFPIPQNCPPLLIVGQICLKWTAANRPTDLLEIYNWPNVRSHKTGKCQAFIWVSPKKKSTSKSSILLRFSIANHPFRGTPIFWKHPFRVKYLNDWVFHLYLYSRFLATYTVCTRCMYLCSEISGVLQNHHFYENNDWNSHCCPWTKIMNTFKGKPPYSALVFSPVLRWGRWRSDQQHLKLPCDPRRWITSRVQSRVA